jgi:glutamate:Na+ symporter, ESS family
MIVISFFSICILLLIGKFLRANVKFLQKLYLPSSVIAGLLGLILVQILLRNGGENIASATTAGWSKLPGFLINIVFGALFLGITLPKIKNVWKIAGPQLAYGQIIVWGQYLIGLGLVLLFLGKMFNLPHLFGVVIPVGFEGGHGTAGGLKETFEFFGWEDGTHFALASATVGIISAILTGMALINWAIRKGHVTRVKSVKLMELAEASGLYEADKRPIMGYHTVRQESAETLGIHLTLLGVAVALGYGLKQILLQIQHIIPFLETNELFRGFPLFPLCMIGGLIVQSILSRWKKMDIIDHGIMQSWSGTALDFLIVAAITTIRVETISQGIIPFMIICVAGILWNLFCILVLAPKLLPDFWFERAIAELGQSMGVTATGLLLLRAVDPKNETTAPSAFAYKQLLHEPFMGGGLWTSSAIPLIIAFGTGWPVFFISAAAIFIWLVIWFFFFRKK